MIHRGLSLSDIKCQQFLECGVFLLVNCLSACFVRIAALSVESRCHIKPARGAGNFDIIIISSGNRHKFTSMFNCTSLVHPCTSVARCQTKFPVPLTALIRHLYFDEPYSDSDKHWKDCFYNQKKTPHFRTVVFRSERKSTANQRNIIVATLLNPSFTIAWNIYGRNRIKNIYYTKIIQISDKANLDLIHSED